MTKALGQKQLGAENNGTGLNHRKIAPGQFFISYDVIVFLKLEDLVPRGTMIRKITEAGLKYECNPL